MKQDAQELPSLSGYHVYEHVTQNRRHLILRAQRLADQKPVIIKLLRDTSNSTADQQRYQHEFDILQKAKGNFIIQAYEVLDYQGLPGIVLEDMAGVTLSELAPYHNLSLTQKLRIALQISQALQNLYASYIIHKDLNPSNIIIHPESLDLKVIDFGISSPFEINKPLYKSPEIFEGSMPYISPEQTGRTNRRMDYRSDFYSFGVTLYELFTGKLPFDSKDQLKLIHYHLAKDPCPPHQTRPGLPVMVSKLITKLMSKSPEDRYQSARGIKHDLKSCLEQLNSSGSIIDFPLASRDFTDQLMMPNKLFGYEREISNLLFAFDRICDGQREILLIKGPAGSGKSSLVSELIIPVSERRGYLIRGQYQKSQQNIPYSGLIAAMRDLVQRLLSENSAQVLQWKHKIIEALSPNVGVVIEVIPELKAIVGNQPHVSTLESAQAQNNRFNRVFLQFIQVFCRAQHPVVMFLDDLEWLDSSSTEMLQMVLNDAQTKYLFLIGSCQHSLDISSQAAVTNFLAGLEDIKVHEVTLRGLGLAHLNNFIATSLQSPLDDSFGLAKVVMEKTQGNPFFLRQFIESLVQDNAIWFDHELDTWQWDLATIQRREITDNVVDLLLTKIHALSEDCQKNLEYAACIGLNFDSRTMELISHTDKDTIHTAFKEALDIGILEYSNIVHNTDNTNTHYYSFSHGRFHEVIYSRLEKSQREENCYKIGQILLQNLDTKGDPQNLFKTVNQLNLGASRIKDDKDKKQLINLNLQSGKQAMLSSAYHNALDYFQKAMGLHINIWQQDYSLALDLYSQSAKAAFFAVDYAAMETFIQQIIHHGRSIEDKILGYEVEIRAAVATNDLSRAAQIGKSVLIKLGVPIPRKIGLLRLIWTLQLTRYRLSKYTHRDILTMSTMQDKRSLAIMNFQFVLAQSLYFTEPQLIPYLICKGIKLSLKHGNASISSYNYACWGMILAGIFGDHRQAMRYGNLGLQLHHQSGDRNFEAPLIVAINVFIKHWLEPLNKTLPDLQHGFNCGLDVGDQEFSVHSALAFCYHSFFAAKPLNLLSTEITNYAHEIHKLKQQGGIYILYLFQQICHLLTNPNTRAPDFNSEHYNSDAILNRHFECNDQAGVFVHYFTSAWLNMFFGRYHEAYNAYSKAKNYKLAIMGTLYTRLFAFLETMILIQVSSNLTIISSLQSKVQIAINMRKIKKWATLCPASNRHRLIFLQACLNLKKGKTLASQSQFDLAAKFAKRHGHIAELALIYETAGQHYHNQDALTIAGIYLRKARYYYERWGAKAKVADLDEKYAILLANKTPSQGHTTTVSSISAATIDIATLKKALMAISDEKIHSKMIEKIISSAIQFAGAQRGCLLLRKDDDHDFFIEAQSSIDQDHPQVLQSMPLEDTDLLSVMAVNYVRNTGNHLVIDNAQVPCDELPGISMDTYIKESRVKSVLCIPIKVGIGNDAKMVGILYLENRMNAGTFTTQRIEILEIICLAAAGRLELSLKAATDGLTGLYNHEYFANFLKKELLQSRRQMRQMSLILIDIDHFKMFNDDWGHQVGDLVLKKVAATVQNACRKSDIVARYGGEEMVVILPETGIERAHTVAERIRIKIAALEIVLDQATLGVTASLGVACISEQVVDAETLIHAADKAMYKAKRSGRNQTIVA